MKTILLISSLIFLSLRALSGEIALSFDDAPRYDTEYLLGTIRTNKIIQSLKSSGVKQVVFFCNTNRFDNNGIKRIRQYINAGHLIANHTHSHPNLDKTDVDTYINDFLEAHEILSAYSGTKKWFRYPYLRHGENIFKRDKMRNILEHHGYRHGYVTVDNYDWYMDHLFQEATKSGQKINFRKLKEIYVKVLWEGILFYDDLAFKTLGYSPKHILLLHENDLAALFIKDLVTFLEQNDWKIISPESAYTDNIARYKPNTLLQNQGQVAAIAKDKGYQGALVSRWENKKAIKTIMHKAFLE